ncbi:hypothetical protein F2P81_017231 [Scophthalmus maximus]|uniref:Uncharacterized protein n=1 Tax=Scophthalmus maximus TaxID=52904 RepID=A0A6A4SF85_SCOMX|nr:hypothetical protein F2P81_017231 [Scophthalmus maximus]
MCGEAIMLHSHNVSCEGRMEKPHVSLNCKLLRSLLCSEEVCGRPEEFQQSSVAPVGPTALRPTVRCGRTSDCTECTSATPPRLGGETTVTSTVR